MTTRIFDRSFGLNLTYTWDKFGHGTDLSSNCAMTGYLGYAYLETPGNSYNLALTTTRTASSMRHRDGGAGDLVIGRDNIRPAWRSQYDLRSSTTAYGPLTLRPAYRVRPLVDGRREPDLGGGLRRCWRGRARRYERSRGR